MPSSTPMESLPAICIFWSGGKDSLLTYLHVLQEQEFSKILFLTLLNDTNLRVIGHSYSETIIQEQVKSTNFFWKPAYFNQNTISIKDCGLTELAELGGFLRTHGYSTVAVGISANEQLKTLFTKAFDQAKLDVLFPLWGVPPIERFHQLLTRGYSAQIIETRLENNTKSLVGKHLSFDLIEKHAALFESPFTEELIHSFIIDGPLFNWKIIP